MAEGEAVTYFCFIESENSTVPHMEPIPVLDRQEALDRARAMLAQHSRATMAKVFHDDELVATMTLEGLVGDDSL